MDKNEMLAELQEIRAEVLVLREHNELLTHKVITCGVAASHPDAGLASRGAYKEKWDSPQAEEVRKLRAEADALRKDADRYRWLRDGNGDSWEQPWVAIGRYDYEPTDCTGKDLDNRMDDAMGAKA